MSVLRSNQRSLCHLHVPDRCRSQELSDRDRNFDSGWSSWKVYWYTHRKELFGSEGQKGDSGSCSLLVLVPVSKNSTVSSQCPLSQKPFRSQITSIKFLLICCLYSLVHCGYLVHCLEPTLKASLFSETMCVRFCLWSLLRTICKHFTVSRSVRLSYFYIWSMSVFRQTFKTCFSRYSVKNYPFSTGVSLASSIMLMIMP